MNPASPKAIYLASLAPSFGVIYADPPWHLGGSGKGSPPYPLMKTSDICALPVESLAAPDCALLLWAVHSHLPDALAVIQAWGFAYKTVAFTWVKRTPRDIGFFLGRGYWGRLTKRNILHVKEWLGVSGVCICPCRAFCSVATHNLR